MAIPVYVFIVLDARLALRAPELHRPGEAAQLLIKPVVEYPGDHLFGVIAKVVIDLDVGVAVDLAAPLADLLIGPKVLDGKALVILMAIRPQKNAAEGVEADAADDVGVSGDELGDGLHLRLGGGVGTGALLLALAAPVFGKVAVELY